MHNLRVFAFLCFFVFILQSSFLVVASAPKCTPCTAQHPQCKDPGSKPPVWCQRRCVDRRNDAYCPATRCYCPLSDKQQTTQPGAARAHGVAAGIAGDTPRQDRHAQKTAAQHNARRAESSNGPLAWWLRDDGLGVVKNATEFTLRVKHDPVKCQGVVTITRDAMCPSMEEGIGNDNETNAYYTHTYGPDAFYVKIVGPEAFVVRMRHQGECEYRGVYQMTLPGEHVLDAQHVYENFAAVTEAHDKRRGSGEKMWWWITESRHINHAYIAQSLKLQCQNPVKDADVHAYMRRHVGQGSGIALNISIVQSIQSSKPPCRDGISISEGRWLNLNKNGSSTNHSNWMWGPHTCSVTTMDWNITQANQCLRDKHIQVLGDSQERRMYYAFSNYLREEKIDGNPKVPQLLLHPNNTKTMIKYDVDVFLEDVFPHITHKNRTFKEDALFFGYGNWPASGTSGYGKAGKWSIVKYKKHLDKLSEIIARFMKRLPHVFVMWLGMPAYPYPLRKDSRRSNERIEYMVELAEKAMLKAGVPVLRPFDITEAMIEHSLDGNHLVGKPTDTIGGAMLQLYCQHVVRNS